MSCSNCQHENLYVMKEHYENIYELKIIKTWCRECGYPCSYFNVNPNFLSHLDSSQFYEDEE